MKIIQGDILDIQRGIIGHQCNALYVMGAGLALQIARKYPGVLLRYQEQRPLLGSCQLVKAGDDFYVANLIGQADVGFGCQTDYDALRMAMASLCQQALVLGLPVYLPDGLGCGLAGGNWTVVKSIIEDELPEATIIQLVK